MSVTAIVLGLYWIGTALLKLPLREKRKTRDKKFWSSSIFEFARRYIAPHVKMNPQKRLRLTRALEVTNNKTTADLYQANAYVKSAVLLLCGAFAFLLDGFLAVLLLLLIVTLAILSYYKDFSTLYRLCDQYKERIEDEVPAFASYMKEKLSSERSVIKLLEDYTLTDNELFSRELEITVASMRTSSPENGLLQLNRRIGSEKLSMVIHGLLGVVRGENQLFYFQMISYDFDIMDKNNLRKRAAAIPKKLNIYMFLLFVAVFAEFITPILLDILNYFQEFFS